jgi:hypothetical protein
LEEIYIMNRKLLSLVVALTLLFTTISCQMLSEKTSPTSAPSPVVQEVLPTKEPTAAPTEDVEATAQAAQESAQATKDAAAQEAEQATKEAISAAAAETAAVEETAAAQVDTAATAQVAGMVSELKKLKSKGLVENINGTYTRLDDFKENWAQIGWYQWWETGKSPANFVIRAHAEWESGSKTADWFNSGCGFVFHEQDENNHYLIYLGLDGNVYLKGYVDSKFRELGKGYAGKINHIKGGADIMLVVEGKNILYFVNGEKALQRQNAELPEGKLALTLVSGTNKDFGTRCTMTNIELWELAGQ